MRPVKVEEHDIDFRVQGLSHAVVKEAEHFRVQELVKKIESHPHREALQADLQQNITSTNHSATIRRRWSANWACRVIRVVRNYTKSTMYLMSSSLESRNCVLHVRTMLDWRRFQKKVSQTKAGCTLYPELRDKKKWRSQVLDMAKPKNRKSTMQPGKRGRDAARKSILNVNFLRVFTIDFSEIQDIVNHNSQSDGQNKSAKSWTNLQMKTYISSHSRGKDKMPRTMVFHLERIRQKWAYEASIRFSSCCLYQKSSPPRVRRTSWSLFLQNNTRYGIPLQAHRGGTSLNGIGNERIRFFLSDLLFVTVGFVYSRWRSTVTDRGVDRYTSRVIFIMQFAHSITCMSHCMAQDEPPNVSVCALHSIFMSSMMCVWSSVGCLSLRVDPSPVSLRRSPLLFHTLLVLFLALHLKCRWRRGLKTAAHPHSEESCTMAIYHLLTKNALSGAVNWQTRKWSNFTKFQVLSWMTINSSRRNLKQMRIVGSLLANCLELLVYDTNWKTWHFMVGQQACKSHKMDSGMWQTTGKVDFSHSSHKRFPTILSCGKHGTALQNGSVPRLRFWRTREQPQEESCAS